MPRIPLIEQREQASGSQAEVFDEIVASRGTMLRPFAAMLHRPELARATAGLGAVIRFQGTLPAPDRELVICTTAVERRCDFEWESHAPLAREAGVSGETLDQVRSGAEVADPDDALLVGAVRSMCRTGDIDEDGFRLLLERLGEPGVVELTVVVGYYSMLGLLMNVCRVC